jgi:hypothetical protein
MGGHNNEYYHRHTVDGYQTTNRGTSHLVEQELSRTLLDPGLLPIGRNLVCQARSPIVLSVDGTGSMDVLPKIFYDKTPLVVGEIIAHELLDDPMASISVIGDLGDKAPIQIGDFAQLRNLDDWFKRAWFEKKGRGNHVEAYELTLFFYARHCDIPNAVTPFFIITGDEGFQETIYASELQRHFGGSEHEDVETADVVKALQRKFKDNVFLVHRRYDFDNLNAKIVNQWKRVLGNDHVLDLQTDKSIADVIIGLIAIRTGKRTIEAYLDDLIHARERRQTEERIRDVRKSLERVQPMPIVPTPPSPEPDPIEWL